MKDLIAFLLELEKLKGVHRKMRPLGLERFENPAEHSWQVALFALAFQDRPPALHLPRVIAMLLVHDLGEIDTGDTFAYVEGGWDDRKRAERAAVERICAEQPILLDLWLEFDAEETPEARFAHALDRAMPVLQNLANGGRSWRENDVTYDRVVRRIEAPIRRGAPGLWPYLERELAGARERGLLA